MVSLTEEVDSGVESMPASSHLTPENQVIREIEDNLEYEEDETLAERLIGLVEMFPESLRKTVHYSGVRFKNGLKNVFRFSKSTAWIFFSTSTILFAPLLFEVERVQILAAQENHQKQVLFGPSTAMTPSPLGPALPGMPPINQ